MKNLNIRSFGLLCAVLFLVFALGCKAGGNASFTLTRALVSIEVTPVNPSIALGTTRQFAATGIYSDNSVADLTGSVTWSSSDMAIATVAANGLATSAAVGSTTITATFESFSGNSTLTVTAAALVSLQVTPTNPGIALGTTRQFTATGMFSDSTTQEVTASVTWSSSDTAVALVSNNTGSNGLATSTGVGSTTITATSGTISANTTLTVTPATLDSIEVTPTNPSIPLGTTRQFTATGIYSDSTTQDLTTSVTWTSSDTAVATVASNGLAASAGTGSTTIMATSGTISGSTILTVTAATLVSIQVTPTNPSIALGTTRQFTATGIYSDSTTQDLTAAVVWSSSLTTVANISNGAGTNGLATSVAIGSTTITAASGTVSGNTTLTVDPAALVSIQVTPTNPSIALGLTRQFTATGIYTDGTNQDLTTSVIWSSSSTTVAIVSNSPGSNGLATPVAAGPTAIGATSGSISGSTTLTVTPAILVSIEVTPTNPSIALGMTRQFTATGIYSDSTSQNVTASVTWSSSDTAVATISNTPGSNGLATSVGSGPTTLTATSGTVSGSTSLTVTGATLASIQVAPTNPSIAVGMTRQFTATGIFSDNTSQDLTSAVTWTSSDTAIATVSNTAGSNGLATSVAAGSVTITATSGAFSGSSTLTVTSATLSSIQVAPVDPSIANGSTKQFTATGMYSDNTTQDLTASVTWSSSDTAVAVISNIAGTNGLATSVSAGPTTITATSGIISGSTTLTVTAATLVSIQVSPTDPSIALCTNRQFTATGIYSDNTTQDLTASVTWISSDTAVATISNTAGSHGLAAAVASGPTTITATSGTKSGSTTLTVTAATLVSIQVSPTNPSIALGTTRQFTAIGIYSDNTTQDLTASALWSSSSPAVAAISNAAGSNGLVSSVAAGSTTITATSGTKSGSTSLLVTSAVLQAIDVTPVLPSVGLGTVQQFTAIGTYSDSTTADLTASVVWSSSLTGVAIISNAPGSNGLVSSVGAGSTTITATFSGVSGSTDLSVSAATLVSIEVSPTDPTIARGLTKQFIATGIYSDNSTADLTASVTWSSSDTAVAAISNAAGSNGLATSVGAGPSTITAALSGKSGSTTLTVTAATLLSIQVSPANPNVALGMSEQFTALGIYSDNSGQDLTATVTWGSSSPSAAAISNAPGSNGLAKAVGVGSTTITATFSGISGGTTLTVTGATLQSIDVTQALPVIANGTTNQFIATGTFSDNTTQDLTTSVVWSSSDTTVAVISNAPGSRGLVTAVGSGTATITAAGGGISGGTLLTVTSASLVSIQVSPTDPTISFETTQQFTATGVYSDGSVQDITPLATWISSNTAAATISNAAGSNGLAVPVAAGTTTISAEFEGFVGTTTLTVTQAVLTSISLSPVAPQIAAGTTQQFSATGAFDNGSTQDITGSVVWTSSDSAIATISNTAGTNGLATSVGGAGSVTITAALGSVTNSTTLTANPVTLSSIVVSNATGTTNIQLGSAVQFRAIATFTDSSTQDVTSQATWKSSSKSVATISNAFSSKGLLTPIAAGSTTVSATLTLNGTPYTGTQTINVVAGNPLQSITVTPSPGSVTVGNSIQFYATGHYADGSTQDLTKSTSLSWSSSNTQIASIKNNPTANKGLATGKKTGTVTISATIPGVAPGTTTLTVN